MPMKTYARIEKGVVAEIFETDKDIRTLFHGSLHWVEVTGGAAAIGDRPEGGRFVRPARPTGTGPAGPTLSQLASAIDVLEARVAALGQH